jgi:hypothetical protein
VRYPCFSGGASSPGTLGASLIGEKLKIARLGSDLPSRRHHRLAPA